MDQGLVIKNQYNDVDCPDGLLHTVPRTVFPRVSELVSQSQQSEIDIKGSFQTMKRSTIIYPSNPSPYIFSQGIRSNSRRPSLWRGPRSFQPAKMEKRIDEYNRFYDDNFYFNHRWDREVWCQPCKIYHGMREKAKKKCEERKKAAEEEEERLLQEEEEKLLQERRSNSPRYHDPQERPSSSHEESPEEMAPPPPPSPPRVNHAAEAWAFYLEREEQKRKESAGTTELETEPQKGSRPAQLRSWIPVSEQREDITSSLSQYPYGTPSIFQNQPSVAPNPAQNTVQNRSILNSHEGQQTIHNPSSAVPISESPSGATENLQRLPPINTELFGPTPDIPLRNHGFKLQLGPSEAGSRFRPGPSPFLDLPDQHESPAAVSNRRDDNQREERYFSPYGESEPPPPAVPKQPGRSRQAGISRPHHRSRERKSKTRKRPSAARSPKPLPLTADQSERLRTLRNLKRKASLSVNDLLCVDEEGVDTVGFADDQVPARASTRRRLSSPSSSSAAAVITPRPHRPSPYTFQSVREEEEKDVEEEEVEEEGADDEDEDVGESG